MVGRSVQAKEEDANRAAAMYDIGGRKYRTFQPVRRGSTEFVDTSSDASVLLVLGVKPGKQYHTITDWVRSAAAGMFGEDAIIAIEPQTLSEDFSVLANESRGSFFWVGAALSEPRQHHTPDFDIDEAVLPICSAVLAGGAVRILNELQE